MTKRTKQKLKTTLLDRGLNKIVSRKLLVWMFATAWVPMGFITGEEWIQLSMIYIGSQAAMDFILNYAKAKSGNSTTTTPELP